jgi:hypothetical protein
VSIKLIGLYSPRFAQCRLRNSRPQKARARLSQFDKIVKNNRGDASFAGAELVYTPLILRGFIGRHVIGGGARGACFSALQPIFPKKLRALSDPRFW